MKNRFGKIVIGMCCFILLSSISVYAITESMVTYHFFSKKAEVHVENYTLEHDVWVPWKDGQTVLPGEYLSKISVIYNDGMDCYIRAQVKITSNRKVSIPITLENIEGISEKWVLIDGYFYYQDIVPENGEVIFFEGITIPEDWDASVDSGTQWSVEITADAVQAEHLSPDFQSNDPWGQKREQYEILEMEEEEVLEGLETDNQVVFTIQSELEEVEIGIEETFQNLGAFWPGTTKEQAIYIRNLDKKGRKIYLKAEFSENLHLLEEMQLCILWECESGKTTIFDGTLDEVQKDLDNICWNLQGDTEGKLLFQFELEKALTNEYAAQEGNVSFTLTSDRPVIKTPIIGGGVLPEHMGSKLENSDVILEDVVVHTGDETIAWLWILCMTVAMCVFVLCYKCEKRKDDGKSNY